MHDFLFKSISTFCRLEEIPIVLFIEWLKIHLFNKIGRMDQIFPVHFTQTMCYCLIQVSWRAGKFTF